MKKTLFIASIALCALPALSQAADFSDQEYLTLPPNISSKSSVYWDAAANVNSCISRVAKQYDDGISDAQTIAKVVKSSCDVFINTQISALIGEYRQHREQLKTKQGSPIWGAESDNSAAENTVAANDRILKEILESRVQAKKSKWFWQK